MKYVIEYAYETSDSWAWLDSYTMWVDYDIYYVYERE